MIKLIIFFPGNYFVPVGNLNAADYKFLFSAFNSQTEISKAQIPGLCFQT
jgi:hypothetical protein